MSSGQQATRTQGAGPVVICCAAADAGAIATVARDLQADGHAVEVVSGVESDPKRLAPVIDRCRGEGLYVLCRSAALGRDAVDELRDVLLARHVPFGRTLTVASTRPRELRERIIASLGRVAAGKLRSMAKVPPEGAPPKVRRTTQLGIPSPVVQPKVEAKPKVDDAAAERRKRNSTQLGIPVADVARLAREMSAAKAEPAAAAQADTRVEVEPEAPPSEDEAGSFEDEEEPTNTRMRAPRTPIAAAAREASERVLDEPPTEPLAKAMSYDDVAAQSGVGAAPEPDPETETLEFSKQAVDKPKATRPPPPPPSAKVAIKPAAEPTTTEDSVARAAVITAEELADLGGTDPKIKLRRLDPQDDFDSIPIRSGDTKVQSLEELGLDVRSGNTAVAHVEDLVRSGATLRVPAVPPASATTPSPPEIGGPIPRATAERPKSSLMIPVALAGGALLIGIVAAIAFSGDDDDADDDDDAKTVASNDGAAKTNAGKSSGGPEAGKSSAGEGGDDGDGDGDGGGEVAVGAPRTKVGEALRSREVLALDILLVTAKTAGPFDYAGATGHCAGLDIAGLGGWRLPNIGELMSLAAAGMTGGGYYWSTTSGDTFGDLHLVWYGKRARVVERESTPNLAVCVRGSVDDG